MLVLIIDKGDDMTKYSTISMHAVDRLVYVQVFLEMRNPDKKRENNPYKQGSVSYLAWNEGFDYYEFERENA